MAEMNKKIEGPQEAPVSVAPNPAAIKAAAIGTIESARNRLRGSGDVTTEIGETAKSYLSLPINAAGSGLKACFELLSLQPIKATCTAFNGVGEACVRLGDLATRPIPIVRAAVGKSLKAAKTVASIPIKAPIKAYNVAGNGVNKMLGLIGINDDVSMPKGSPATPPPPGADRMAA